MASNIPLGSFFEDGVRAGPLYSGDIPNSLLPFNPAEKLSYSAYSAYGPGILQSTQNTWNITPAPTTDANIVGRIEGNSIGDINRLTLLGDNIATKLISQSNTPTNTQFDWPRVPVVTISGNNLVGPTRVTIIGYDWYGIPIQHTYIVQNAGTYPSNSEGSLSVPSKAFYSVTQVSLSAVIPAGTFISVGAGDIFGLPFLVNNSGDITSIGWGNNSDLKNSTSLSSPVIGTATFIGGTVTVPCNAVTTNSNIQVTRKTLGAPLGNISVPLANRTANTSFVINSTDNAGVVVAETSTLDWEVINPSGQYTASGISGPFPALNPNTLIIYTSQVQSDSNIQLTLNTFGTAHGQWYVSEIIPGVSFSVTSTDNTETSTVSWVIIPQNFAQGTSRPLGSDPITPVAGEIFVSVPNITSSSNILLTYDNNPAANGGILSAPSARIQADRTLPNVGFTIVSSNPADTAKVDWVITNLLPNLTQGTSTLAAGTVTVPTTSVAANSVILLSYNTFGVGALGTYVRVSAIVAGTSFDITSEAVTDISTINWAIFPANFFLPNLIEPLGTFVGADQTFPPSSTTGDVRGLYGPSTPSDGVNVLRFTSYVQGADQWINQVANNQFLEISLNQDVVGTTIATLNPKDLYGYPQFYTGLNS